MQTACFNLTQSYLKPKSKGVAKPKAKGMAKQQPKSVAKQQPKGVAKPKATLQVSQTVKAIMEKLVVFLEESGAPQTREDILAALNTSVKGTRKALHAMSEHGMILHEFKEISENGQLVKKSFYRSKGTV